jgi:Dolichyl-phosphate-mannose-protein mannosyltransferase
LSQSPGARGLSLARLPLGLAVAALCLTFMIVTEPYLAIAWDEGYTLGREARLRDWFGALRDPVTFAARWQPPSEDLVPPNRFPAPRPGQLATRAGLFSPVALDWFWPFAREEPDGHPPFYALLGLIGDFVAPNWETLPRARFAPMLVFSLMCGAIFSFSRSRYGLLSAVAAAGAWMLQPHLFALAHYATYDGLLSSLWTGSVLSFAKAVQRHEKDVSKTPRWRWVSLFGFIIACAMGTKLTGWFLPLPFLAWVILYRDQRGLIALLTGVLLAFAILVIMIPPWWQNPVFGLERFLRSNFTRAETTPLKSLFLGHVYKTPIDSLPWYNTVVWTVMVTPVGFLVLACGGMMRAVKRARTDAIGMLFLVHWIFLMTLRALPHTPGHDAVRQFLPAFGVLALLAGLGAATTPSRPVAWGKPLIFLSILEGAVSVGMMMPVPLSYFSPLVGGLPGAVRLGMEPTYYWDSLQPEILEWLNSNTAPDQKVMFSRYPTSLLYLRHTNRLRVGIMPHEPGRWAWYVLQNRPGAFRASESNLIAHGEPAAVFTKSGVPLLWVYPYHLVEAWQNGEWPPSRVDRLSPGQQEQHAP